MKFKLDRKSQTPLHRQAEKLLRELIEKEEYKTGEYLPNEIYLSKQLNISRNTLRQAINQLVAEGLLSRKKGVGTKVLEKKVFSEANQWLSFSQEMRVLNIEVHDFELHIGKYSPTKIAKNFFNLQSDDTKLFRLERLRGKKDFPFVYFISEFNPTIPFSITENFNRPLYNILEHDFNIIVKTSQEEISAEAANNNIAAKLEVPLNSPVLVRKRFVYDINNVPIEYNIGWYRADSFNYKIVCIRD